MKAAVNTAVSAAESAGALNEDAGDACRVVLAGGPGAGKTSLLAELARRGHAVQPDTARAVIAERQQAGLPPRPPPQAFARALLARDLAQFHAVQTGWVFFDRSALDALAMLHELGAVTADEARLLQSLQYHRNVFLLPPWHAIYVTDAQRDHDFAHAERVYEALHAWYLGCGYTVVTVPCAPVPERADFVLHTLGIG